MGCNSRSMSGIITIEDGNGTDLKVFNNYGYLRASDITVHSTTYVNVDTRQIQKMTHFTTF